MEYIATGLIVFAAGLIQGLSGFGSAMISMALLTFVIDLKLAVPLVAVNSIIISTINYWSESSFFVFKDLLPLLAGAIAGAVPGVLILKYVDPEITKIILGLFILSCSLFFLLKKSVEVKKLHIAWGYLAGFAGGIFGGACTVNGPPIIIYLAMKCENKGQIKVLLAAFFLAAGAVNIFAFALAGFYTMTVLKYCAAFSVFTISGVLTGNSFYKKINQHTFKKFIYIFLALTGTFLIIKNFFIN